MWIEISDLIPEVLPRPDLNQCAVLQAVADASFHGRHVLYASSATLTWLYQQDLSAPAKAAIKRTKTKLAEKGAIRANVRIKLIIDSLSEPIFRDDQGNWHASIQHLVGVPMLRAEILAENTRDVDALKYAALHYKKIKNFNELSVALMPHNGGGAEILNCFKKTIGEREKFTCAITDSDKDHPAAGSSHISRECKSESDRANWVCRHFELPFREMENILPLNIIHDSIMASTDNTDLYSPLADIFEIAERRPDAIKYIDVKEGTSGSFSSPLERNIHRREYWAEIIHECNLAHKICDENCSSHPCECKIFRGLGSNVLQKFLDYCDIISIAKQVERVKTSLHYQEWLNIGAEVFDWAQADPPLRA